jgi:shikimate kinase
MLDRKVLLMGPMGAGKSTIGEILAKELGWKYFDNDTELSKLNNMSSEELGELPVDQLHGLETSCLENILSRPAPFISGAAASVIDYKSNRELIKSAFVVYLRLPLQEIIERAGSTGIGRQFLRAATSDDIRDRFNRRDPLYKECAKLTVELSQSSDDDAKIILQALKN